MDKNRKGGFIQTNRSFDLNNHIQLATFGVFIYSKMEHKINKNLKKLIYQQRAQDLTIYKMHLFSQYDDHDRNYKQVNNAFFHSFGVRLSYFL